MASISMMITVFQDLIIGGLDFQLKALQSILPLMTCYPEMNGDIIAEVNL